MTVKVYGVTEDITNRFICLTQPTQDIYLFKVNNKNTIKRCKRCSKLTIKPPERHYYKHISQFFLELILLILTRKCLLEKD